MQGLHCRPERGFVLPSAKTDHLTPLIAIVKVVYLRAEVARKNKANSISPLEKTSHALTKEVRMNMRWNDEIPTRLVWNLDWKRRVYLLHNLKQTTAIFTKVSDIFVIVLTPQTLSKSGWGTFPPGCRKWSKLSWYNLLFSYRNWCSILSTRTH